MDRKLGNCSIIPIQNASFDASINISVSTNNNQKQFVVRMKSPSQLFYLDNTSYTYEGQVNNLIYFKDTVVPAKSESGIMFCLQGYQVLESIDYMYINPIRRIGSIDSVSSSRVYKLMFYLTIVNKTRRHCHSWLARQYLWLISMCTISAFCNSEMIYLLLIYDYCEPRTTCPSSLVVSVSDYGTGTLGSIPGWAHILRFFFFLSLFLPIFYA